MRAARHCKDGRCNAPTVRARPPIWGVSGSYANSRTRRSGDPLPAALGGRGQSGKGGSTRDFDALVPHCGGLCNFPGLLGLGVSEGPATGKVGGWPAVNLAIFVGDRRTCLSTRLERYLLILSRRLFQPGIPSRARCIRCIVVNILPHPVYCTPISLVSSSVRVPFFVEFRLLSISAGFSPL